METDTGKLKLVDPRNLVYDTAPTCSSARAAVPPGGAQAEHPPDDPKMIEPDAAPLDADVERAGDGPVPPDPARSDDPAPGIT